MKNIITVCLMLAIMFGITGNALASDETETARGALEINVDVIHDTREVTAEQHRFIGHEVAPNLFLGEKTQLEYQRRQQSREHLNSVQEQLFLDSGIDTRVSDFTTESVLNQLFAEGSLESSRVTRLPQYLETVNMPSWIIALFVVLGFGAVALIGITLGKHLSHLLHGRRQAQGGEHNGN